MKFTLKDYQRDAVHDALANLRKARRYWHNESDKSAFSLTAVTGAGKTVMAAAAFEALFHGDDEFNFDADPGAVVIWFSDDPALNEQTRFRLMEASDRINYNDMVVVEHPFSRRKFQAGKIYFLNTQKFGKKSLLVRGFDDKGGLFEAAPDAQAYTLWDTIQNTIEDPDLTLYLVLDEAHRGMGSSTASSEAAKSTIVQRLINGSAGVKGIPVVWGISATVERFDKAIANAGHHVKLPNVVVDPAKVQESGLIKDDIILGVPDEAGDFDTVWVRRAADKLREATDAWAEYARQQETVREVVPLMVFQVPNTPDPNEVGRWLDTLFSRYRNPQYTGQSSLGIAYVEAEQYKIVRPDFLFFAEQDGKMVVDLVDPHSLHLADVLPKLEGLALYAEHHSDAYRRIESVAEVKGKLRVLDLKRQDVQDAVATAENAETLFSSGLADDYQ